MPEPRERVVVAMSGGVDSSVAAALLVEQGYEVVGIMLRLWSEPPRPVLGGEVEAATNRCCSAESVHEAASVADRLGIPFYAISAEAPFKQRVVDAWIDELRARPHAKPVPQLQPAYPLRLPARLRRARLAPRHLATGHYARLRRSLDGRMELWRGMDRAKDQSYVLSVLGQDELDSALFPVGEYTKPQVRALAAERGLPTASRVDSQDLCFVTDGDYRRFLADQAPELAHPGPIVDSGGRRLGEHRGLPFYTVGQRSGLGIAAAQPLYVLRLDVERNALVVGERRGAGSHLVPHRPGSIGWPGSRPAIASTLRSRSAIAASPSRPCVTALPGGGAAVEALAPLRGVTPGQAAVFYRGDDCLGNGLILAPQGGGDARRC